MSVRLSLFANCRSQYLIDRLGRCHKLFVSIVISSSQEFAPQLILYRQKQPAKTRQKQSVHLIARSRVTTTGAAVVMYIYRLWTKWQHVETFARSRVTTGAAVAVYIGAYTLWTKQRHVETFARWRLTTTGTSRHWVSRGLQPASRHATSTIITGPTFIRKRLWRFIYYFPLDCAALPMICPSMGTRPGTVAMVTTYWLSEIHLKLIRR